MPRPPFNPYRSTFYVVAILAGLAVGIVVFAVTTPNNIGLGITAAIATVSLSVGIGSFRYNESGLEISLGGVVVRDVAKVRLTARVRGPRAIKPVAVQILVGRDWIGDLWDADGVVVGLGEKLDHAGELIVDFRRDRLMQVTGRDWPSRVRIVDSFGLVHERKFQTRPA